MPSFGTRAFQLVAAGFALTAFGLLSGCGGEDGKKLPDTTDRAEDSQDATSAPGAVGSLEVDGRTFTFTADVCLASDEDSLISGPGEDTDGTLVYVDLDSVTPSQGEITVEIGTDQKFSSGDEALRGGDNVGSFLLEKTGSDVVVTADFSDDNGSPLGSGVLAVTCS